MSRAPCANVHVFQSVYGLFIGRTPWGGRRDDPTTVPDYCWLFRSSVIRRPEISLGRSYFCVTSHISTGLQLSCDWSPSRVFSENLDCPVTLVTRILKVITQFLWTRASSLFERIVVKLFLDPECLWGPIGCGP